MAKPKGDENPGATRNAHYVRSAAGDPQGRGTSPNPPTLTARSSAKSGPRFRTRIPGIPAWFR